MQAVVNLKSTHTTTFAELLAEAGASLAVTAYQNSKVFLLSALENGTLNNHVRHLPRPMGIAKHQDKLAIAINGAILQFQNQPDLAAKAKQSFTAVFRPRSCHYIGGADVHEVAYPTAKPETLNPVFAATRFNCLGTLSGVANFTPLWRPWFIADSFGDRCHLNGIAMRYGRPMYVSALASTATVGKWKNRANEGILIDTDYNEIVASGLAYPHSPRWHNKRLWFLESGKGALCFIEPSSGAGIETVVEVCRLPGFVRGLDFIGPYALVGLSKVRNNRIFADMPLPPESERCAGVWAIDTRTGETIAYVKFDGTVEEIFSVLVLNTRRPQILLPGDPAVHDAFIF